MISCHNNFEKKRCFNAMYRLSNEHIRTDSG